MSDPEAAVLYVLTSICLMECFFVAWNVWRQRPPVAKDWNTGRYRSVRLMARERRR